MAAKLQKSVERIVETFMDRGRPIVVKMTQEGIVIKRKGEHWNNAVTASWAAIFSTACKLKAQEDQVQKKVRRVRRGLL